MGQPHNRVGILRYFLPTVRLFCLFIIFFFTFFSVEEVDGQEERVEAPPRAVAEEEMERHEIAPAPFPFYYVL